MCVCEFQNRTTQNSGACVISDTHVQIIHTLASTREHKFWPVLFDCANEGGPTAAAARSPSEMKVGGSTPREREPLSSGQVTPSSPRTLSSPSQGPLSSHNAVSSSGARLWAPPLPPPINQPELISPRFIRPRQKSMRSPRSPRSPRQVYTEPSDRERKRDSRPSTLRRQNSRDQLVRIAAPSTADFKEAGGMRSAPTVPKAPSLAEGTPPLSRRYAEQLAQRAGACSEKRREKAAGVAAAAEGRPAGGADATRSPPRLRESASRVLAVANAAAQAAKEYPSVAYATTSAAISRQQGIVRQQVHTRVNTVVPPKDDASANGGGLKSFAALRAAADAHASALAEKAATSAAAKWERVLNEVSPSMHEHDRRIEEERMRRARQRADFLLQRAEEEQVRDP